MLTRDIFLVAALLCHGTVLHVAVAFEQQLPTQRNTQAASTNTNLAANAPTDSIEDGGETTRKPKKKFHLFAGTKSSSSRRPPPWTAGINLNDPLEVENLDEADARRKATTARRLGQLHLPSRIKKSLALPRRIRINQKAPPPIEYLNLDKKEKVAKVKKSRKKKLPRRIKFLPRKKENVKLEEQGDKKRRQGIRSRLSSILTARGISPTTLNEKLKPTQVVVKNVHELRREVLQNRIPLKELEFNLTTNGINATTATTEQLLNHPTLQLMAQRLQTNSTPGNRGVNDTAHLALAIEGGGMRGAVSAGMAAAIASLGLIDTFDSVYGSSAGAIVGAYLISRQICVDVYTQVLPAAGTKFASKSRVLGNVGVGYVQEKVEYARDFVSSKWNRGRNTTATSPNNNETTADNVPKQRQFLKRIPLLDKAPAVLSSLRPYLTLRPGMNLTFILEGIMSPTSGLRPFDMETFRQNDAKQPLKAVASTWRHGQMETVAFGSAEGDFWDIWIEKEDEGVAHDDDEEEAPKVGRIKRSMRAVKGVVFKVPSAIFHTFSNVGRKTKNVFRRLFGRKVVIASALQTTEPSANEFNATTAPSGTWRKATACPENSGKSGFFACLESSMLVPGAAGPPVKLLRSKHRGADVATYGLENMTSHCYDAFSYEAIPYRSAVEDGADHVLTLLSRPDGCVLETEPYTYEKIVAPVYFRRAGLPKVGEFFEKGGSQYRYVEDIYTLSEGLVEGCKSGVSRPVKIAPTKVLSGTPNDEDIVVDMEEWNSAHILPVSCKANTPELPTLTQEKKEVVSAVRDGFVAAFDMLAPIAEGLKFDPRTVDSRRIAEIIFPIPDDDEDVLDTQVQVKGDIIEERYYEQQIENDPETENEGRRARFARWMTRKRRQRHRANQETIPSPLRRAAVDEEREHPAMIGGKADSLDWLEAEMLLAALPGFQEGKLTHLADGLSSRSEDTLANDTETTGQTPSLFG